MQLRKLEEIAKRILKQHEVPDFSTIFYRMSRIPIEVLKGFLEYLGKMCSKIFLNGHKSHLILIGDGTCFTYNDKRICRNGKKSSRYVRCFALGVVLPNNKVCILTRMILKIH